VKRVMIVGGPGAGKTTVALSLANITGLPVFHIDQIHYQPGWVERPLDEKITMAKANEAKTSWIIEGGLSSTYGNRCRRADTMIWLDLPVRTRLARIVKRRMQYSDKTRPDLPENCPERLAPGFLAFILRTRNSGREKIAQAIAEAPHLTVHHLRTAKGANTFLDWTRDDYANRG